MAIRKKLLIGLFPSAEVRAEIEAHRQDWWWPRDCTLPPEERLHLTLQYLEDLQGAGERRLRTALSTVSMQSLQLELDRSRTWPNDVSVVQPAEHEGLRALQQDIHRVLLRAGFALQVPARGWRPHVTIARNSQRAAGPMELAPIRWTASEFRLVRSHLTTPFRHEPLASYPLH